MSMQDIINAIQPEAALVILALVVSGAGYLYQWGIQRLPERAQKILNSLAQTVVQAVEQKYSDNSGAYTADKKQKAMSMLETMCQELGLKFNQYNASAAIEAAVYSMNLAQQFHASISNDTQILPAVSATPAPTK